MTKDELIKMWLDCFLANPNQEEIDDSFLAQFISRRLDNISIGPIDEMYINVPQGRYKTLEYAKIIKFIEKYTNLYANQNHYQPKDLKTEFINYGKTELVYVLTHKPTMKRVTLLVKQPAIPFGQVKQEHDNLLTLAENNGGIVAPIDYYADNEQELFVTPYIFQARCIASDSDWGMYIPEPFYRFQTFSDDQEHIVNVCMIAKLISLYNPHTQQGLGMCRLGGGDFMLPKDWETITPTIKDTLSSLQLIAAREMINCSFDEYKNIIIDEFSRSTINEENKNIRINHRGRVPMSREDILEGIAIGEKLLGGKYSSLPDCY